MGAAHAHVRRHRARWILVGGIGSRRCLGTGRADSKRGHSPPLRLVRRSRFPGWGGSITWRSTWPGKRLFVAPWATELEVVDLKAGQRVQGLPGFREPQGVRFIPESARGGGRQWRDGTATFLEAAP